MGRANIEEIRRRQMPQAATAKSIVFVVLIALSNAYAQMPSHFAEGGSGGQNCSWGEGGWGHGFEHVRLREELVEAEYGPRTGLILMQAVSRGQMLLSIPMRCVISVDPGDPQYPGMEGTHLRRAVMAHLSRWPIAFAKDTNTVLLTIMREEFQSNRAHSGPSAMVYLISACPLQSCMR